jgi:hypothetical protein
MLSQLSQRTWCVLAMLGRHRSWLAARGVALVTAALLAQLLAPASAAAVTLSNTQLPVDTSGNLVLTGEASVLQVNSTYYIYMNDWGGCQGIDCCDSPGGCASCCFSPPTPAYNDTCVYTGNHSVVVYSTSDFVSWSYEGIALGLGNRLPGIEFRPQVVYSPLLGQYVMWYEDRWTGQEGYAVATAPTPAGPFTTIATSVVMPGAGRVGDFALFIDDDGIAWHVRTGITIVQLTANYTAPTAVTGGFVNGAVEGPSLFKRAGVYYLLTGVGCCACIGGSNVLVYTAASPLGPYTLQGDVGSNSSAPFNASSPFNYVTRAQGSAVFTVPNPATGELQYVWLGNQWATSQLPGQPRNHDLLYWTVLNFNSTGGVQQIVRADNATLYI